MKTMKISYRKAAPEDAAACIAIRGQTRENAFSAEELRDLGITPASWSKGIADGDFPGIIACDAGKIIGYCFGDWETGEIIVLALLPEYEGVGIGKQLLQMVVEDFQKQGFKNLFLGCSPDPNARSYGFYRHLGWQPTGRQDEAGDEILELHLH